MANYKLNAMTGSSGEANSDNENFPREGLVNDVCRGWLLHEDQALAYRLQSEEYQNHLGNNKERNAILRQDTPRAMEEQFREDEEAARTQNAIEAALAEQEARDAALAAAIAADLERKELEQLKLLEFKDFELAKKLTAQDRAKIRHLKEIRQVEREAAYLGINSGLDNVAILSRKGKRNSKSKSSPKVYSEADSARSPSLDDLSDLSDFCIKPVYPMDEDEERRLQEEQDEELARLLQEQDLKRRGDLLQVDQLSAIEAQDKELAKILQEQEKSKAKKGREKARQKALLNNQSKQPEKRDIGRMKHEDHDPNSSFEGTQRSTSPEFSHYASVEPTNRISQQYQNQRPSSPTQQRPPSPQYATPILRPREPSDIGLNAFQRPDTLEVKESNRPIYGNRNVGREFDYFQEEPPLNKAGLSSSRTSKANLEATPPRSSQHESSYRNLSPSSVASPSRGFPNIACAIDPTYERRVKSGEFSSPSIASPVSPSSFTNSVDSPVSSPVYKYSTNTASSTSSVSSNTAYRSNNVNSPSVSAVLPTPVFDDEDDYLPPPYMPIQGQRRTESLEKRKVVAKLSKDKGSKEGICKQQ